MAEPSAIRPDSQPWAQPFRLTLANGDRYDGVQFPSGRVVLDHPANGLAIAATTLDHLLAAPDMQGATVEHPEETA